MILASRGQCSFKVIHCYSEDHKTYFRSYFLFALVSQNCVKEEEVRAAWNTRASVFPLSQQQIMTVSHSAGISGLCTL